MFGFQQKPTTPAGTAPAPAAGAPPAWGQPAAPPAAPAAAAPAQMYWVVVNGAPAQMTMEQMRTQAPSTPACIDGSNVWSTVGALLPAQPAAAPAPAAGAPAWNRPAAAPAAPSYQAPAPQHQQQYQASNGIAPAGMFEGVENAKVFDGGGDRITDGDYVAVYCGAQTKEKRDKTGSMVFFEVEIVKSTFNPADATTHQCIREGRRVSVCLNKNDSFLCNFKEVVLALSGFDAQGQPRPDDSVVTKEESLAVVGPEQKYVGALVFLEVRTKPQVRNPQKTFTYINWWPCPRMADGSPDLQRLSETR